MDFAEARTVVQRHLDRLYRRERESPRVLAYGFDTGRAYAPLIDWDGVMGAYVYLVDKRSGRLIPLNFAEFADMPDPTRVGDWPPEER